MTMMKALLLSLLILLAPLPATSFSPEWLLQRLPGIWTLRTRHLPYEPDIRSKLQGLLADPTNRNDARHRTRNPDSDDSSETILLKLNQDGTFKQCDEGFVEGKWISGNWRLVEDLSPEEETTTTTTTTTQRTKSKPPKLVLAMNRQYYGPQFDVVLDGCLEYDEDDNVDSTNDDGGSGNDKSSLNKKPLAAQGSVQKGKYLHPRGHTSFFDPPFLASPETVGPFSMEQSLAAYSILGARGDAIENKDHASDTIIQNTNMKIQACDFHNKPFILTIEPLKQSKASQQQTQTLNQLVDIRSLPVTFFANNTFCAMGTNKILRGRYQVREIVERSDDESIGNTRDDKSESISTSFELSMAVSLFGAGRSAPGSVYSEGMGLTHEDERTYIGAIQQQILESSDNHDSARLYVQGTVFFGTDLGEDARPEPVASFYLIEDTANSSSGGQVLSGNIVDNRAESNNNEDDDNSDDSPFGVFE